MERERGREGERERERERHPMYEWERNMVGENGRERNESVRRRKTNRRERAIKERTSLLHPLTPLQGRQGGALSSEGCESEEEGGL